MDIRIELETFRAKFNKILDSYLEERIADARKRDHVTAEGLRYAREVIMAGGKRLRPALVYWAYKGSGGADDVQAMRAAMSVELIHAFLLVHDDIMDRDALRHGKATIHERYRKKLLLLLGEEGAVHAGNSIAIVLGDLLAVLGNHTLFTADFDKDVIFHALAHLQEVISYTVIGQLKDVTMEYSKKASREDVLSMYEYKTARYTIESPLVLGSILAGVSATTQEEIHDFAIPLGIAFQIQDDVLGLFGDEKKIGKSVGSDIREGKMTLLVVIAQEKLSGKDVKKLQSILGKKDLNSVDIEMFRTLITQSGARAEAEAIAHKAIAQSSKALKDLSFDKETKDRLTALSEYLTDRTV